MIGQNRLNKFSIDLIGFADKVIFVSYETSLKNKHNIALIYTDQYALPFLASAAVGHWYADDVAKAMRTIRRHNKECKILEWLDVTYNDNIKFTDFLVIVKKRGETDQCKIEQQRAHTLTEQDFSDTKAWKKIICHSCAHGVFTGKTGRVQKIEQFIERFNKTVVIGELVDGELAEIQHVSAKTRRLKCGECGNRSEFFYRVET